MRFSSFWGIFLLIMLTGCGAANDQVADYYEHKQEYGMCNVAEDCTWMLKNQGVVLSVNKNSPYAEEHIQSNGPWSHAENFPPPDYYDFDCINNSCSAVVDCKLACSWRDDERNQREDKRAYDTPSISCGLDEGCRLYNLCKCSE